MSSKDNDKGWIFPFAMIGAAIYLILIAIYAIMVFLSLLLTVLALCSWIRPITVLGEQTNPEGCRQFVLRGLIGALLLPSFAAFFGYLVESPINESAWIYIVLGGYAAGSLGIELLLAGDGAILQDSQTILPPEVEAPEIKPAKMPEPEFTYADWLDDGEIR